MGVHNSIGSCKNFTQIGILPNFRLLSCKPSCHLQRKRGLLATYHNLALRTASQSWTKTQEKALLKSEHLHLTKQLPQSLNRPLYQEKWLLFVKKLPYQICRTLHNLNNFLRWEYNNPAISHARRVIFRERLMSISQEKRFLIFGNKIKLPNPLLTRQLKFVGLFIEHFLKFSKRHNFFR